MKKISTSVPTKWTFLFVLIGLPFLSFGQGGDPAPGIPRSSPVAGGIELLVGAGLLYGIKRIRDARRKER